MKFGRYLTENATPEWKRAYIDYRAAKKAIKRVAQRLNKTPDPPYGREPDGNGGDSDRSSSGDDDHGPTRPRRVINVSPKIPPVPPASAASGVASGVPSGVPSAQPPASLASPAQTASPAQPSPQTLDVPHADDAARSSGRRGLTRSKRSPRTPGSYGAMGTSPRLTQDTTGFGAGFTYGDLPLALHRHHSKDGAPRAPPPLDLGEPSMDNAAPPSAPPTGTDSSGATLVSDDDPRSRHARHRSQISQVNFSPVAEAIPSGARADDEGSSSDHKDLPHSPKPDSPYTGGSVSTAPASPATMKTSSSRRRTSAAISPLLSRISSRLAPTAGMSVNDMSDAPSGNKSIRSLRLPSPRMQPRTARSFEELYDTLEPDEKAFFDLLDHELDKVENFYCAREAEATRRAQQLRTQLRDLAEHRRVFHEVFPEGTPEWEAAMGRLLPIRTQKPIMRAAVHLRRNPFTAGTDDDQRLAPSRPNTPRSANSSVGNLNGNGKSDSGLSRTGSLSGDAKTREEEQTRLAKQYDPDRYQKSKKELRSAMLEFYRHLELIKNYRILNLTGFRKALKKFEKATHIQCLELYTEDRIAPCSFSRGETIDTLLKQSEDLFTEHFEHGNSKRARNKLRQQDMPVTHYLTVFRSGIMLGLGAPAAILALVKSFDPETRAAIPSYSALLQIYSAMYMPVLFAMLFELNLQAWVEARINYEFVMELDRPSLDYRSYFEIPCFLFLTLSYCMFFSFYRVATHSVAPTTWPAAWLVFVAVFFLNPLPILRRRSRYWFLKVLFRVCTPGYSRVDFIAFFIADELNSLVYSIQNIYFLSCVYAHKWPGDTFGVCPSGRTWPYALLACLPPLVRLIQCLKRFKDSNLHIHLINAGKYASSIMAAIMFIYWRGNGSRHDHPSLPVWIIFATLSSIYTSAWDLVVDWSLLRPHHRLLRLDLGYSHKSVYYFAMVTNVIIRFIWVWYLPLHTRHTHIRSWVFAMCEMLRRWQWNFFRVETEHLGNADAYRVTREIPLPYRQVEELDDDPKGMRKTASGKTGGAKVTVTHAHDTIRDKLSKIRQALVGEDATGRGPGALNVGARGHAAQREYEARRPGDVPRRNSGDSGDSYV